jgi:hypothetical protein
MHRFDEIGDVTAGLDKLMQREPPLAAILPRLPGSRESRYAHLLSGPVESVVLPQQSWVQTPAASGAPPSPEHESRIAQLEATVAELQNEIAALRQKIDDLFG